MTIISPSSDADHDVVYEFGQVSIDRPLVDYKGNCGNISAAAGAAAVDGTIMGAILDPSQTGQDRFRLGHPGGVLEVEARVQSDGVNHQVVEASFGRTARRLMEGRVLVPEKYYKKS